MPIISKISAASCGGSMTHIGAPPWPQPMRAAAKPATGPIYEVPAQQLALIQRAGIHPGDDRGTIDRKLGDSGLDVAQRIQVKNLLARCGILSPGIPR
jgi:hypothetical protein